MEKLIKTEVFEAPQKDRVAKLGVVIPEWMAELKPDEMLIVSIPPIIKPILGTEPIVVGRDMVDAFKAWLEENAEPITGPIYNMPALKGFFTCIIAKEDYDPAVDGIPETLSEQLRDSLATFDTLLRSREAA